MKRRLTIFCLVALAIIQPAGARDELFRVEDFKALPPEVKILAETTTEGITQSELTFQGAPFNGHPTRIYAYYTRPATGGEFPGVVLIHGASLGVLPKKQGLLYAQNGFACLTIDWAGPAAERKKPRTPPYSEFVSPGSMARKSQDNSFQIHGVEADTITNGVRFILRGLEFLRNQPEVAEQNLFLSGTSAGAHLTLVALGLDPNIRGASVKYGNAYIRDMPGYFGGYFGPISLSPRAQQDAWLAALDPKHGIPGIRANVLMMSGTDDIFFWMPVVLHTYRQLPAAKHLIMFPNDNHRHVSDETVPIRYFQSILEKAPKFMPLEAPKAAVEGTDLVLTSPASSMGEPKAVHFIVKRMPRAGFSWMKTPPWELIPATRQGGQWLAKIQVPAPDEQIITYLHLEDTAGAISSSDTLELPDYPAWRGLRKPGS